MGFVENGDAVHTPHFDAFAAESAVFNNAIVEVPVCSPSRATMITGRYAMHHGQHRLGQSMLRGAERDSFFSVLKAADYHIGYIGKWHIITHPHEVWRREQLQQDPDYFSRTHHGPFGIEYTLSKFVPPAGQPSVDFWISGNNGSNLWQQVLFQDDPDSPKITHEWEVDSHTRKAIEYLTQHRPPDRPFACFVSINVPHPGWEHDRKGRVVRPNVNVAPARWEEPYHQLTSTGRPNFIGDAETFVDGYYGAVSSVDDCFGQLLQTLKDIGEYENTVIVYTSDHGDLVGSHGYHAKSVWYEESIGVPLMIGYPGVIAASEQDILFSNVHLMPTLLGLMGLPVPGDIDGRDFSPLLRGETVAEPEEEPIAMLPSINRLSDNDYSQIEIIPLKPGTSPSWWGEWRGVRTPRYTYAVQFHQGQVRRYLYDNQADPYQMNPIADDSLFAEFDNRVQRWLHPDDPFWAWVGWR
jgi:arylsulfatase A-like enzyme